MYVRWDLDILEKGNYKMKVHFRNPIEHSGELVVRIGTQNFTLRNENVNTRTITYDKVELNPGKVALESWYYMGWGRGRLTPFYVELTQI